MSWLKTKCRNWLGIKKPQTASENREEIAQIVKEAITLLVCYSKNNSSYEGYYEYSSFIHLSGLFERKVEAFINERINNNEKSAVEKKVNSEEFIDSIVERIKSKQL